MAIRILAAGYLYTLAPGEEAKLQATDDTGALVNSWLLVEPSQDWLGAAVAGERIQLAHVVAWCEVPDEPPPAES